MINSQGRKKLSMPRQVTSPMSQRAAQIAREGAVARGWKSSAALLPIAGPGYVGIKTEKKYHMYQEQGTKPFLMRSLEGKTVPINGPDGLHFVKVVGVGQPGWVTLPGGIKKWRDQKWRHPGIKATNLMRDSIAQAVREDRVLVEQFMNELIGNK